MRERLTPEQRIAPAADLDQLLCTESLGEMPHHALVILPSPGLGVFDAERRERLRKRGCGRMARNRNGANFGNRHDRSHWRLHLKPANLKDMRKCRLRLNSRRLAALFKPRHERIP